MLLDNIISKLKIVTSISVYKIEMFIKYSIFSYNIYIYRKPFFYKTNYYISSNLIL